MDKHIRRLDTDLARFEADLKEKQIESTDYDSTSSKGNKSECCALDRSISDVLAHAHLLCESLYISSVSDGCLLFEGDHRGPKKKEVTRTRSKVKNSDDDCSSKSGQKKVKLTQRWESHTFSVIIQFL